MARRTRNEIVGANVHQAIIAAGTDIPTAAQAVDLTDAELGERIKGATDFKFGELVSIGGLSCVPVSRLMQENVA